MNSQSIVKTKISNHSPRVYEIKKKKNILAFNRPMVLNANKNCQNKIFKLNVFVISVGDMTFNGFESMCK